MRLDKLLTTVAAATRTEAAKAARAGEITVNGEVCRRADRHVDPERDRVVYRGREIRYKPYIYFMLNKPAGYVSATEDRRDATVLDLIPEEFARAGLFPVGRLDIDTTGLLLLSNDGQTAHLLLSPKRHVPKRYAYTIDHPLSEDDIATLERGVDIGGYVTKPARVEPDGDCSGVITISEGKFHQIKRMMQSVGNEITSLCRISFGPIELDASLPEGQYRELTDEEEALLRAAAQ